MVAKIEKLQKGLNIKHELDILNNKPIDNALDGVDHNIVKSLLPKEQDFQKTY
jgi:hypothetical protein